MSENGNRPESASYLLELSSSGRSPVTVREYGITIRRWQQSGLSPVDYLATIQVKPSTRTYRGIVIRRYLEWAVAKGFEAENPLASIHFHAPPAPSIRPFSQAEIDALLGVCRRPVERAVILLLLETGLRASELAGIRPERDIDQDCATVVIQRGKGGKSRRVALDPTTVQALRTLGTEPLKYQVIYYIVRCLGRRAGVTDTHPHRFRHTFAHNFLSAGGDRGDLRILLGHANYQMVDRYAGYFEEERALAAHKRFMAARDASQKAEHAVRLARIK